MRHPEGVRWEGGVGGLSGLRIVTTPRMEAQLRRPCPPLRLIRKSVPRRISHGGRRAQMAAYRSTFAYVGSLQGKRGLRTNHNPVSSIGLGTFNRRVGPQDQVFRRASSGVPSAHAARRRRASRTAGDPTCNPRAPRRSRSPDRRRNEPLQRSWSAALRDVLS